MNKKLRRLPDWIEDIRGAIKNIREDIKGLTKGQFLDDGKSQRAVAKSVSDIGEAAHPSSLSTMILVTGSTGYIGSHTCVALAQAEVSSLAPLARD